MNRRSFFRCLPGSLLAVPALVKGEPVEYPPIETELSVWVELDCTYVRREYGNEPNFEVISETPCATRFKVIRGTVAHCPKCGMQVTYMKPDNWDQFVGIEVKK